MTKQQRLLRLLKLILGPQRKALPKPAKGAFGWKIAGTFPQSGFSVRSLVKDMTPPWSRSLTFDVTRRGRDIGYVTASHTPARYGERATLDVQRVWPYHDVQKSGKMKLGVGGYKRLFDQLKNAAGIEPGTRVNFQRIRWPGKVLRRRRYSQIITR